MSDEKIDVLAVLDEVPELYLLKTTDPHNARFAGCSKRIREVRAAVAELIEAAEGFPDEPNPYTYRMAHAKLKAALARVRSS